MEFLLPSLLLLLAAAFFVFGLFPRLGPSVLVTLAIVSLVLVVQHHMELFDIEYRDLTIIDSLKDNAPMVLVLLSITMIIGYFLLVTGFLSGRRGASVIPEITAEVPEVVPNLRPNTSKNNNGSKTTNNGSKTNNANKSKEGQSLGAFFSKYA
jgi:hypothetical protein